MALFQNRRRLALASGVVLLLLGTLLAFWYLRADAQLARVRELQQQLRGDANRNLPPEQRREQWQQLRAEMDTLTPDQRRKLGDERQQAMRERLKQFFAMSKQERAASLDKQIDRREAARKEQLASGNNPNGAGPGRGGRNMGTPEERELRRKQRLDQTTPEDRAMMAEFRREMQAQRQQRGFRP